MERNEPGQGNARQRPPVAAGSTDARLLRLLSSARTIAIVGLSRSPHKDSHRVARYLQAAGYEIIPVNPVAENPILGVEPKPRLEDISASIDIVNVFRRSKELPFIIDSAIRVEAGAVWAQMGIEDRRVGARARAAGLTVVMNRCIMVEHRRLIGPPA